MNEKKAAGGGRAPSGWKDTKRTKQLPPLPSIQRTSESVDISDICLIWKKKIKYTGQFH